MCFDNPYNKHKYIVEDLHISIHIRETAKLYYICMRVWIALMWNRISRSRTLITYYCVCFKMHCI